MWGRTLLFDPFDLDRGLIGSRLSNMSKAALLEMTSETSERSTHSYHNSGTSLFTKSWTEKGSYLVMYERSRDTVLLLDDAVFAQPRLAPSAKPDLIVR
jgi:hypothetical protein